MDKKYDRVSKRKHKSRSRSRSKSRGRERNKEKRRHRRSPSRSSSSGKGRRRQGDKDKRKSPSPVKETVVVQPQTKKTKFSLSATVDPEIDDSFLMGAPGQNLQALALAQAAKVDRKLYIGNLPSGISPPSLVKILNSALSAFSKDKQDEPVLSAWVSSDGHYAFVEFRSAEEANNGFLLNNISIMGQPLKVGRPKTYQGVMSMMEEGGTCNTVAAALQAGTMSTSSAGRPIQFPTKILIFKDIAKGINVDDEEEYNYLQDDLKQECTKHGRVLNVFIPRKDVEDNPSPGYGSVFVEFQTIEEAKETRKQLSGRKFNERTIQMVYISEEKFRKGELGDEGKSEDKANENPIETM